MYCTYKEHELEAKLRPTALHDAPFGRQREHKAVSIVRVLYNREVGPGALLVVELAVHHQVVPFHLDLSTKIWTSMDTEKRKGRKNSSSLAEDLGIQLLAILLVCGVQELLHQIVVLERVIGEGHEAADRHVREAELELVVVDARGHLLRSKLKANAQLD